MSMTLKQFITISLRVIKRDGFDGFLPTACFPRRPEICELHGLPSGIDLKTAVLKWAEKIAVDGEEFFVAFKSGPLQFTVIRRHGEYEEAEFVQVRDT